MKNMKIENLITVVLFTALLFSFSALFFIMPDKEFSEQENRTLQQTPELTVGNLISGEYSKQINTYFADQFPFRDFFVGVKGAAEAALLKRENNNVVLGKNGMLATRSMLTVYNQAETENGKLDFYNKEATEVMLDIVGQFSDAMQSRGIELALVFPPRSIDISGSDLPSLLPSYRTDSLFDMLDNKLGDKGYIDLKALMTEKYDNGEYVYYRTDHHWTTLGAYYAYAEIMKSFSMDYYPLEAFMQETVADDFYGTTWSKSGFRFIKPDSMSFFHLIEDSSDYSCIINDSTYNGGGLESFYDRSKLLIKDKYAAFLGGSYTHTTITKSGTGEREKLILIKDSFGHSVAPFLALHFDIEMVDLTYSEGGINKYFDEYDFDKAVVVFNIENIISTEYLGRLRVSAQSSK